MTIQHLNRMCVFGGASLMAFFLSSCAPGAIDVAAGGDAQARLQAALIGAKPTPPRGPLHRACCEQAQMPSCLETFGRNGTASKSARTRR
jgi:hypothetical protein